MHNTKTIRSTKYIHNLEHNEVLNLTNYINTQHFVQHLSHHFQHTHTHTHTHATNGTHTGKAFRVQRRKDGSKDLFFQKFESHGSRYVQKDQQQKPRLICCCPSLLIKISSKSSLFYPTITEWVFCVSYTTTPEDFK